MHLRRNGAYFLVVVYRISIRLSHISNSELVSDTNPERMVARSAILLEPRRKKLCTSKLVYCQGGNISDLPLPGQLTPGFSFYDPPTEEKIFDRLGSLEFVILDASHPRQETRIRAVVLM